VAGRLVRDAYNYGRRLKTLSGLTPYEGISSTYSFPPHVRAM